MKECSKNRKCSGRMLRNFSNKKLTKIKGTLKTRPIYHWDDNRIKGHITMCFLAYFCEAQMTKLLREKKVILESKAIDEGRIDKRPLTVLEAMQELVDRFNKIFTI